MTGRRPALAVSLGSDAARVVAGALWLTEGIVKYRAGFGAADILLVAGGADGNGRAPSYLGLLAEAMRAAPGLFGGVVPAGEIALGVLLVAGVFGRWAAFASIGTLMLYWASDQLIGQYPVMALLAAAVLLAGPTATVASTDALVCRRRLRREDPVYRK